jgi:hypothetical protein
MFCTCKTLHPGPRGDIPQAASAPDAQRFADAKQRAPCQAPSEVSPSDGETRRCGQHRLRLVEAREVRGAAGAHVRVTTPTTGRDATSIVLDPIGASVHGRLVRVVEFEALRVALRARIVGVRLAPATSRPTIGARPLPSGHGPSVTVPGQLVRARAAPPARRPPRGTLRRRHAPCARRGPVTAPRGVHASVCGVVGGGQRSIVVALVIVAGNHSRLSHIRPTGCVAPRRNQAESRPCAARARA